MVGSVLLEITLSFNLLHSVQVYSLAVWWCSQAFPGRCIPGWSPCVPAISSTADRSSRVCSKTSAASRRRSTQRSSSHTACHSCSRSSDPARSPRFSFHVHVNKTLVRETSEVILLCSEYKTAPHSYAWMTLALIFASVWMHYNDIIIHLHRICPR